MIISCKKILAYFFSSILLLLLPVILIAPKKSYAQVYDNRLNQLRQPSTTPETTPYVETESGNQNINQDQEAEQNQDQATFVTGPLSLSVSPPVTYLHVKPSGTLRHTVMITNTGSKTVRVTTNVTDFTSDGSSGQPILQPGRIFNKQVNPDLDFGEEFTLSPQENRSVNLALDVSQLAAQQEYHLAILFNAQNIESAAIGNDQQQVGKTQVAGTIASNLIVYISEDDVNQGQLVIKKLNTPSLIDSFGGVKFDILAANNGGNATPINGRATITNIFGQTINEYIFYPDYVLADSSRMVRGTRLNQNLLNEEGKLDPAKVKSLTTQFHYRPPFMFGLYNLTINLGTQTRNRYVVALPFSLIVLAGVGVLIYLGYQQLEKME